MSRLDAAMIPYGVVPGNHDEPATFYNQYFGVNRFCNAYPTDCRSYYGGGYPSQQLYPVYNQPDDLHLF